MVHPASADCHQETEGKQGFSQKPGTTSPDRGRGGGGGRARPLSPSRALTDERVIYRNGYPARTWDTRGAGWSWRSPGSVSGASWPCC